MAMRHFCVFRPLGKCSLWVVILAAFCAYFSSLLLGVSATIDFPAPPHSLLSSRAFLPITLTLSSS